MARGLWIVAFDGCALMSKTRSNIRGLSPGSCCHLFSLITPGSSASGWEVFPALNLQEREAHGKRSTFCTQIPIHREFLVGSIDWQPQSWIFHAESVVLISRNKIESKGRTESFYCLSLQMIKEQVLWGYRLEEEFEVLLWGAQKDVPQCLKENAALFHCASD